MGEETVFNNEKNGTSLEIKTKEILEIKGWNVDVNQPYKDVSTLKQRDIDIIARKNFQVKSQRIDTAILEIILIIDCKNLPNKQGLYSQSKNKSYKNNVLLGNQIYRDFYSNSNSIEQELEHRYLLDGEVIFNSTKNDDNGLGLSRINQVLSALNSKLSYSKFSWNLKYPVILINSFENLQLKKENKNEVKIEKNFLYQRDFIVNENKKSFYVDIVSLGMLESFLLEIEKDARILHDAIHKKLLFEKTIERENDSADNFTPYY